MNEETIRATANRLKRLLTFRALGYAGAKELQALVEDACITLNLQLLGPGYRDGLLNVAFSGLQARDDPLTVIVSLP